MRTFGFPLCSAFIALVLPQALIAQSGSFEVSQLGHQVGTASFEFIPTQGGFKSTSLVRVSMKGLDYALSKTEQLSAENEIQHVQLSATVNGSAVFVTAKPDTARLLLNVSANGRSSTAVLDGHAAAIFLPDFDPGALETLLALGVSRNSRDLWAVFPKQSGDQPATVAPVQLATYADEQGMLDGKPIAVHHLAATMNNTRTELFSGPENQLLQAELPQQGFALVRKGFVLTPPARAPAPVSKPAPAPGQGTPPAS